MTENNGGAAAVVVVGGRSAMAREAVEAVLRAAGVELGTPRPGGAMVLLDPTDEDWGQIDRRSHCVVITIDPLDADGVLAAVMRGADAVLEADAPPETLVHAVRVVCDGGTELSPLLVRLVADALRVHAQADEPTLRLTKREREILVSIDAGETVKQTARTLGIAPKTVENLQSRLFRKLGVRNRAQAVALAHSLGLVAPAAPSTPSTTERDATAAVRTPQPSV